MKEMDFIELMYYSFKLEILNSAELKDGKLNICLGDGSNIKISVKEIENDNAEKNKKDVCQNDCDEKYLYKHSILDIDDLKKYLNCTINCIFDAVYSNEIVTFKNGKRLQVLIA